MIVPHQYSAESITDTEVSEIAEASSRPKLTLLFILACARLTKFVFNHDQLDQRLKMARTLQLQKCKAKFCSQI